MSSLFVKSIFCQNPPPPKPSAESPPPPTTHKLPIKAEAPKPPEDPRVSKAVSGSLVPPTHQGAQSFLLGQKVSLSFFLLRSYTQFVEILYPKKETNRQVSYLKKGHFFDFTLVGCGSQGCVNWECYMVETWCGLLLGMKPFRFRGYLLQQVITSRILIIWLDNIIFNSPNFLGQKIGAGKPRLQTIELGNMITRWNFLSWTSSLRSFTLAFLFGILSCGSTMATQKRSGHFPQSFPPKTRKKTNRTFRLSTSTFRLWNLLEVPVEMVLGANHHLRIQGWLAPTPPTRSNTNKTNLVEFEINTWFFTMDLRVSSR